jgi:hypothetical protein
MNREDYKYYKNVSLILKTTSYFLGWRERERGRDGVRASDNISLLCLTRIENKR